MQLTFAVQNAIENGDIIYAADVADWDDAPPLDCPVDYEEVVRTCASPVVGTNRLRLRAGVQLRGISDILYASGDIVRPA